MKTKQRLITCFNTGLLLLVVAAARAEMPPLLPAPAPQQVLLQLSVSEQWLSSFNRPPPGVATAQTTTERIKALLQQAQETGDQRVLGQALHLLNHTPSQSIEVKLLRATTLQALHRFDFALEELRAVLQQAPDNAQAWLLQASLLTVRGEYTAAQTACRRLLAIAPPLLSGSCSGSVQARQGQAQRAYTQLERLYRQTATTQNDVEILHYAQVSLAEIADQLGEPAAAYWWSLARESKPKALYTLIGAARNAYYRGAFEEVLGLTENATDIDSLVLLRTQAMQRLGRADAWQAQQVLARRVEQALKRGDTLHARDQAAILLDLLQRPEDALALAQINWQQQREPEDTALLLRAALAAHRQDIYLDTVRWLQQWNQWHVRYPTHDRHSTYARSEAP